MTSAGYLLGIISLAAAGTANAGPADWKFIDVTNEVVDVNPPGIGPVFDYAFLDLNDDNYLDIVLNNHHQTKPSPIWLGTPDHRFKFWRNMPAEWLPIAGFHLGEVDHNGDGRTDLICTGNEGGVIVNLNTSRPGTPEPSFRQIKLHQSSHLVSFTDFEGDGTLETLIRPGDIYRDLEAKPIRSGVQMGNWTVADFDNDGWPDLFAAGAQDRRAAWSGPRKLFRNNKGTLEEVALQDSPLGLHLGGIPKIADFDHDGNFDLFIFGGTDGHPDEAKRLPYPLRLYLGDGKLGFRDASREAGFAESTQKTGYSHVYVADIDNDSHPDLITEGNYGTRCWRNHGDGTFSEVPGELTAEWAPTSHLRLDDFDMDGRLDIVTAAVGAAWEDRPTSIRIFRNATESGNHWLKLQLRRTGGNTMCLGSVVTVLEAGTRRIIGKSMLSSDTEGCHPRLHFGLGRHEKVDVEATFPGNPKTTRFENVTADHYLILRPDGTRAEVQFGGPRP